MLKTRIRAELVQQHAELDAEAVVEQIARGAMFNPADYYYTEAGEERYDADAPLVAGQAEPAWRKGDLKRQWSVGDLKPIHELTEAQAQCIAGVEVVMKNAAAGDGVIDRVLKYKFEPRSKYVEMAAKYHSLLVDKLEANVNVQGIGARLDQARERAAKK